MELVDDLLKGFTAVSHAEGRRIDLSWQDRWIGVNSNSNSNTNDLCAYAPDIRIVRQQRGYPQHEHDGLPLIQLSRFLSQENTRGVRIQNTRYDLKNRSIASTAYQAFCAFYYPIDNNDSNNPRQIALSWYQQLSDEVKSVILTHVEYLEHQQITRPPWEKIETTRIYGNPNQQIVLLGEITIYTPPSQSELQPIFEFNNVQHQFQVVFEQVEHSQASVSMQTSYDEDSGECQRQVSVQDTDLQALIHYYYQAFEYDIEQDQYHTQQKWQTSALSTDQYDMADKLYQLVPGIHKKYDEPVDDQHPHGQLKSYLEIFGSILDQTRSFADGLRSRHDTRMLKAEHLPHLAHLLGWSLDHKADALKQRNEIDFAAELYKSVGTLPNLRALVNRITGWECEIKEFANNVFVSNAPESVPFWDIWIGQVKDDGIEDPGIFPYTDNFEGHPVSYVNPDQSTVRFFWHSDRSGRLGIWSLLLIPLQEAQPHPLILDEHQARNYKDQTPAIVEEGDKLRLFWASNRDGHWNIYTASDNWQDPFNGKFVESPNPITTHKADDINPSAVRIDNQTFIFWQSNRRGVNDIFWRIHDGLEWSDEQRLTLDLSQHISPHAVVDSNKRIWLFYSEENAGRSNLCLKTYTDNWRDHGPITQGWQRDQSPSAMLYEGNIKLFWHTKCPTLYRKKNHNHYLRKGHWQILTQSWVWDTDVDKPVTTSEPVSLTTSPYADKEPNPFIFNVQGHDRKFLIWRSQRRSRYYQSTSIDFSHNKIPGKIREDKKTINDRLHYTYDTRKENENWYSFNTVGLYLTTDSDDVVKNNKTLQELKRFLRQFVPAHIRLVYFLKIVKPPFIEELSGLSDAYEDTILDWNWLRSVEIDESQQPPAVIYKDRRTASVSPVSKRYRSWHAGVSPGED